MKHISGYRSFAIMIILAISFLPNFAFSQREIAGRKIKQGMWKNKMMEYAEGLISVRVKKGVDQATVEAAARSVGGSLLGRLTENRWVDIDLPKSSNVFTAIQSIQNDPAIDAAIPMGICYAQTTPNDPYYNGTSPATYAYQWGFKNTGASPVGGTPGADIKAEQAWSITT